MSNELNAASVLNEGLCRTTHKERRTTKEKNMSQDFLSQEEVEALLKGVTGEYDGVSEDDWAAAMVESTVIERPRKGALLETAEREIAYWTGVVHALTGKVKAPNAMCMPSDPPAGLYTKEK